MIFTKTRTKPISYKTINYWIYDKVEISEKSASSEEFFGDIHDYTVDNVINLFFIIWR